MRSGQRDKTVSGEAGAKEAKCHRQERVLRGGGTDPACNGWPEHCLRRKAMETVYAHRSLRKFPKEKKRFEVEVRLRIFFFPVKGRTWMCF